MEVPVLERFTYSAYGEVTAWWDPDWPYPVEQQAGLSKVGLPYLYTGQRFDTAETGIPSTHARKWVSRDKDGTVRITNHASSAQGPGYLVSRLGAQWGSVEEKLEYHIRKASDPSKPDWTQREKEDAESLGLRVRLREYTQGEYEAYVEEVYGITIPPAGPDDNRDTDERTDSTRQYDRRYKMEVVGNPFEIRRSTFGGDEDDLYWNRNVPPGCTVGRFRLSGNRVVARLLEVWELKHGYSVKLRGEVHCTCKYALRGMISPLPMKSVAIQS